MKTIYLKQIIAEELPNVAKEFPTANYMTFGGDKYETYEQAERQITEKMVKRGYAKPKIEVV